ncbi:MAG: HAD family phosphatase [Clostridia bacterium]|nr:HAD family phosphatase [Clostridia bacterium]
MDTKKACYLFFDYDNTVYVNRTISERTISAMTDAQRAGHKLILCTGRARGARIEDYKKIPWDAVINGGCDITYGGRCVEEKSVAAEDIRAWVAFSMQNRRFFAYEGQKENGFYHFEEHKTPYTDAEIREMQDLIVGISAKNPATKFSILGTDFDASTFPKTRMNPIIHPTYVEVFGEGCDKGRAIKRFCELFDVPLAQCACFGDSMNDYAMFEICPVGICMAESSDALKAISTYVAQTDEGVAEGLAWLFNKGEAK